MGKVKFVIIFICALLILSFIILAIMGTSAVSSYNENNISLRQAYVKYNNEYIKEEETQILGREVYLNYDNDKLDNNTELMESSSIYYTDTDEDGLFDDLENKFDMDILKNKTNNSKELDGTKVFLGEKVNSENLVLENIELGIKIEKITPDDYTIGVIEKENGEFINDFAEKAFSLIRISKGAEVSIQTTAIKPMVISMNILTGKKINVNFNKKDGNIIFTHSGENLLYVIGEQEKLSILQPKEYTVIKSNLPLMKGFTIYEQSEKLFDKETIDIKPEEVQILDKLKLKSKKMGKLKGLLISGISNSFYGDLTGENSLIKQKYTLCKYDLLKELQNNKNDFIEENTFNINNFSTSLERQNMGAGLAYALTMHNKEIKNKARFSWDTQYTLGLTTEYDFTRDLNGYKSILENNFGKYKFSTKLVERQDLDTTINPDLQVLKFIEIYNELFEKNKNRYLITNKYNVDNLEFIKNSIDNQNLPMFGIKTKQGGIYLTGYKYEISEFSDRVLKVYVYDPNYVQNKINGKDISNELILYLIKTPSYSITGEGKKELTYSLQYYYNPFNVEEYKFNNIDNRNSELDIFLF